MKCIYTQAPCGARLEKGQKKQLDRSTVSAIQHFVIATHSLYLRVIKTGYRRVNEETISCSDTYGSSFLYEKPNWHKEKIMLQQHSLTGSVRTEPSTGLTLDAEILEQQSRDLAAYLRPIELLGPIVIATEKAKQVAPVSAPIRGSNSPPIPPHYFAPSALRALRSTIHFFARDRQKEISEDILHEM